MNCFKKWEVVYTEDNPNFKCKRLKWTGKARTYNEAIRKALKNTDENKCPLWIQVYSVMICK